jgi:hypothetical protein
VGGHSDGCVVVNLSPSAACRGDMMNIKVQTCAMKSLSPLEQVVRCHGRELAVIRDLVEKAARDAVMLYRPWGRAPKGGVMSGMTRDRFLEFAQDSAELTGTGVAVKGCGDDWVRVWLPALHMWVHLRSRPRTVVPVNDDELFIVYDLFGLPPGCPVLFWQWNKAEQQLATFSVAWVTCMDNWVVECPVREELEISAGLMALPALRPVPGEGNDDDDLPGLVGRWGDGEPKSEDQVTDEAREGGSDDDTGSALGEDAN